jgi:hypothetical protein
MTEGENLMRWKDSGHPHIWVLAWTDDEYAGLLATLRAGPYWPLTDDDIAKTLDAAAKTLRDLQRWGLLIDKGLGRAVPASPTDEEIFFDGVQPRSAPRRK